MLPPNLLPKNMLQAVQPEHIAPLVACLRKFLSYGAAPGGAVAAAAGLLRPAAAAGGQLFGSPTRGGISVAYRPPQRRPSSLSGER